MTKAERRRILAMKWECHRLIYIIWGKHSHHAAYNFIGQKLGLQDFHFSQHDDYALLFRVRTALQAKAIKNGILTTEELDIV